MHRRGFDKKLVEQMHPIPDLSECQGRCFRSGAARAPGARRFGPLLSWRAAAVQPLPRRPGRAPPGVDRGLGGREDASGNRSA